MRLRGDTTTQSIETRAGISRTPVALTPPRTSARLHRRCPASGALSTTPTGARAQVLPSSDASPPGRTWRGRRAPHMRRARTSFGRRAATMTSLGIPAVVRLHTGSFLRRDSTRPTPKCGAASTNSDQANKCRYHTFTVRGALSMDSSAWWCGRPVEERSADRSATTRPTTCPTHLCDPESRHRHRQTAPTVGRP